METDQRAEPEVESTADWQIPSFTEINMNAEIGAYQPDDGDDYEPI